MYNILLGGAAGQGIETTAAILEKMLKRSGYHVFTIRDFMSRVRGGHNFTIIRFGTEAIQSHSNQLDGIIAFNEESAEIHRENLKEAGFLLCDSNLTTDESRAVKIDMIEISKQIGNPNVSGTVAIGAVLKLFGIALNSVEDVFKEFIREKYLEINIQAVQRGYELVETRFPFQKANFDDWMIITGNKALALGAIAAGLKFYSAYPMSPSTSIMEYLAEKASAAKIVVEQAEDEIAAINMAIGASFAGARSMTGTSGGGFSLKVEALGLSGMAEIPLVAVNVQRPGPVTGLPTRTEQSDLKFVISASQGEFPRMVIALRHHADAFYQTIRAFRLAETYQIPVIILSDQYLADASATVAPFDLSDVKISDRESPEITIDGEYLRYRFTDNGISPRLIPGKTTHLVYSDSDEHDEKGWITESAEMRTNMMDKRMKKIDLLKQELLEPEFVGSDSFTTLFIAWGSTYGPVSEAVHFLNACEANGANGGNGSNGRKQYAALVFGDIYPLPEILLREKAAQATKIINIEMNATGQLAGLVREYTGIECTSSILKYDGRQISGEEIVNRVLQEGI